MTEFDLKQVVTKERMEKYNAFVLDQAIGNIADIRYCPNPKGCHFAFDGTGQDNLNCPFCKETFCLKCNQKYHGEYTCA